MRKISDLLISLAVMLFIVSAAVTLTLAFRPLYYYDLDYLKIAEDSGYSPAVIRENYDLLIDYHLSPFARELVLPDFPLSETGRFHFVQTRAVFQFFLRALVLCGLLLPGCIVWKRKRREYGYLKVAGLLLPVILLGLGGMMAANWERTFVLFHQLLFRNQYWIFDAATDPVILILPETFFFHCALLILLLTAIGSAACLAGYHWSKRRK